LTRAFDGISLGFAVRSDLHELSVLIDHAVLEGTLAAFVKTALYRSAERVQKLRTSLQVSKLPGEIARKDCQGQFRFKQIHRWLPVTIKIGQLE